jgi:hypothetical protein
MKLRERLRIRRYAREAWIKAEFDVPNARRALLTIANPYCDRSEMTRTKKFADLFFAFWDEMGIDVPDTIVQVGEPIDAEIT